MCDGVADRFGEHGRGTGPSSLLLPEVEKAGPLPARLSELGVCEAGRHPAGVSVPSWGPLTSL